MKNMKYKIDEKDAEQKIYDDLFDHVMHMLNEHSMPVDMVASTLVAIGQRLYRTHLTDRSYHALMEIIRDTDVEPYNVKKERLH
jgi:tRNA C32,U32 (ribose-2'-O)-methylase TrmJ